MWYSDLTSSMLQAPEVGEGAHEGGGRRQPGQGGEEKEEEVMPHLSDLADSGQQWAEKKSGHI